MIFVDSPLPEPRNHGVPAIFGDIRLDCSSKGLRLLLTEVGIIDWIRRRFPGGAALTDDCGAIPMPGSGEELLVTTDLMESGRHFRLDWHPPKMLGHKLLAANLSDLDSSAARPLGFTFTLAVGGDIDSAFLEFLLEGLASAAHEYGVPVLGGDTVGRDSGLGLGVTAIGATARRLHRNGVRVGDAIFVDNMPGASLRGLRKLSSGRVWDPKLPDADILAHLDPRPDIGLGHRLGTIPQVHACIDTSDGLSKDLATLADASDLSIVVSRGLSEDSLYGGEDYCRCFASSLDSVSLKGLTGREFHPVGSAIPRAGAPLLRHGRGGLSPVEDRSFGHFSGID